MYRIGVWLSVLAPPYIIVAFNKYTAALYAVCTFCKRVVVYDELFLAVYIVL